MSFWPQTEKQILPFLMAKEQEISRLSCRTPIGTNLCLHHPFCLCCSLCRRKSDVYDSKLKIVKNIKQLGDKMHVVAATFIEMGQMLLLQHYIGQRRMAPKYSICIFINWGTRL
jgi:hypothetical protein